MARCVFQLFRAPLACRNNRFQLGQFVGNSQGFVNERVWRPRSFGLVGSGECSRSAMPDRVCDQGSLITQVYLRLGCRRIRSACILCMTPSFIASKVLMTGGQCVLGDSANIAVNHHEVMRRLRGSLPQYWLCDLSGSVARVVTGPSVGSLGCSQAVARE
jgi:hypothetical protein